MQLRVPLLALAVGLAIQAQPRRLCLEDRSGLDARTREVFQAELNTLLAASAVLMESCRADSAGVRLVLVTTPPERYHDALGLTWRSSTRLLPLIEIYTRPVVRALSGAGVFAPAPVGRALARVAAHELAHYYFQKHGHDSEGLMREGFRGWELASDDPAPYALAVEGPQKKTAGTEAPAGKPASN